MNSLLIGVGAVVQTEGNGSGVAIENLSAGDWLFNLATKRDVIIVTMKAQTISVSPRATSTRLDFRVGQNLDGSEFLLGGSDWHGARFLEPTTQVRMSACDEHVVFYQLELTNSAFIRVGATCVLQIDKKGHWQKEPDQLRPKQEGCVGATGRSADLIGLPISGGKRC